MQSVPVFLKSVPIVTTSRKSAKFRTARLEGEPITMSFTVGGGGGADSKGGFLVGCFSCPNSSISTKNSPGKRSAQMIR